MAPGCSWHIRASELPRPGLKRVKLVRTPIPGTIKWIFLRRIGVREKLRLGPVGSLSEDTKENFPRRVRLYSWISLAAPGDVVVVVYALVALTVCGVVATAPDSLQTDTNADGISLLGVFTLITFSVQRFLEPLKAFLDVDALADVETDKFSASLGEAVSEIGDAHQASNSKILGSVAKMRSGVLGTVAENVIQGVSQQRRSGDPTSNGDHDEEMHSIRAEKALQTAKGYEVNVARIKATTSVVFWGIASCISMILSEAAGVGILHVTGLTKVSVPLDIIITGFAVGAGTKPLNDLLSKLEK